MKKLLGMIVILWAVSVAGCEDMYGNVTKDIDYGIGIQTTYTVGGVSFNMIQATHGTLSSAITFPTGSADNTTATITTPFMMAETQTTYELWSTVYTWATTDMGGGKRADGGVLYIFANSGQMGSIYPLGGVNTSGGAQQPVTKVNWRDAIVWCNALTEYYNSNNGTNQYLDCVYYTDLGYTTPLRISTTSSTITYTTAGSQDDPYVKASSTGNTDMANCLAKGFRLPTINEYEYASRYRGTDSTNTVSGYSNPYFTKGNSASGATASYNDSPATTSVAVYGLTTNSSVVKTKAANALGLYDMNGNFWVRCFDWYSIGNTRSSRGGSYSVSAIDMQISYYSTNGTPWSNYYDYSFRFAKNFP